MRAFIAIDLPDHFACGVDELARALALRIQGRFVRSDAHHITLAFLGDINEAQARMAMQVLEDACTMATHTEAARVGEAARIETAIQAGKAVQVATTAEPIKAEIAAQTGIGAEPFKAEKAARTASVVLAPQDLGSFGRPNDATLFLRLQSTPEVVGLASRVRTKLDETDLDYDRKKFLAHITLARHARLSGNKTNDWHAALEDLPFPEAALATQVTLYRSILRPDGARYKPLYTVELRS